MCAWCFAIVPLIFLHGVDCCFVIGVFICIARYEFSQHGFECIDFGVFVWLYLVPCAPALSDAMLRMCFSCVVRLFRLFAVDAHVLANCLDILCLCSKFNVLMKCACGNFHCDAPNFLCRFGCLVNCLHHAHV